MSFMVTAIFGTPREDRYQCYTFDYDVPDYRRVFAEQANNALRAGQTVVLTTESLDDPIPTERVHGSEVPETRTAIKTTEALGLEWFDPSDPRN